MSARPVLLLLTALILVSCPSPQGGVGPTRPEASDASAEEPADAEGDADASPPPPPPPPTSGVPQGRFAAVESRGLVTCGLRESGTLACWTASRVGVESAPGAFVVQGSGAANVCGVSATGSVHCPPSPSGQRAAVPRGPFTRATGGDGFRCGLSEESAIECWAVDGAATPTPPEGRFQDLCAGDRFVCGLAFDGNVRCAGLPGTDVGLDGGPFERIAASRSALCALDRLGAVHCSAGVSEQRPATRALRSLSIAGDNGCGVDRHGRVLCWGPMTPLRERVPDGMFRTVTVGESGGCALREDGTVQCWGEGYDDPSAASDSEGVDAQNVQVDPDVRLGDVRGVRVSLQYRASLVGADPSVLLEARLRLAKGSHVMAAVQDGALRDGSGRLRARSTLAMPAGGSWQSGIAFLPFYAMKLPPGPHRVVVELSALGLAEAGLEQRPLEVRGAEPVELEIRKPHSWTVEVGVAAVSVDHRSYDQAARRPQKALPDLSWHASFDAFLPQPFFRSATKTDQYDGTWKRTTGPFPWSEGDRLTIRVVDVDLVEHDKLGSFSFSLEELEEASKAGTLFKARRVKRLELGVVKIQ